ncbi:hypothetical protein PIB30_011241 [Stylosanthes scabra]|uniref:Uncharacterized protein n=1 Tax=Stylosanthes scabra TaxID=79078 RepID=A0ABU6T751_9FABA|nr:hypothetical protein [Stylosanthes scabra]
MCCLEFMIQPPTPKSTRYHRTDKLYRVPAVIGSNLLSPGPQALVPVVTVANHVRSGHLHISPHSRDTIGLYSLIAEIIKARK